MSYTFLSATYANPQRTAAIAFTEECGAVALSVVDTPEEWTKLKTSKIKIASYPAPDPPEEPAAAEKLAAFLSSNPDVMDLISGP